jgi:sugar phosphate isomerase/epimerase
MKPGGVVLLTATIQASEVREISSALDGTGIDLIDSPVSGGFPDAQSGTLTMMAAGGDAALAKARPVMDDLLPLIAPAIELAKAEGVTLVVETGNGTMVNSCWTGRKLIDDLDAKGTLKILWDPANNCWAHETAYPDGYETMKGGYLGHVHIKDVQVDTPKAFLEVRPMGEGQLADQFRPMGEALRADGYDGAISFESVYHPGDGDFEAGFRTCIGKFKEYYG